MQSLEIFYDEKQPNKTDLTKTNKTEPNQQNRTNTKPLPTIPNPYRQKLNQNQQTRTNINKTEAKPTKQNRNKHAFHHAQMNVFTLKIIKLHNETLCSFR